MEDRTFQEILNFSILELGSEFNLTVLNIFELVLLFILTFLALFLIKKTIYKSKKLDLAKKYSLNNLTKYVVYTIAFIIFFNILGFELKYVMAGSAALLVGIGLGLQNLFSDFVSGIIILIDSSIKVGDILDVDGLICQVEKINLRTTLVLTRDDKFILLPNSLLTKQKIVNWTHSKNISRFEVDVSVARSSDVELTMKLIKEAGLEQKDVLKDPDPFVRLNNFGTSSLDFTLYFWVNNVFRVENTKSAIRVILYKKLKENNINIPFPQHVLHVEKENIKDINKE
ncbi:MAG TPA: mechanosensitive ion channel [Bacteroidales bacterium]|nr:mechanosensitive ion channel [Bacteroidales bacterium]HOR60490.1 mechanosensitive ion channel [Bacteroidales bacterium]HPL03670.1 mechanosensitive ion channel [Bacteroidales bacterium]